MDNINLSEEIDNIDFDEEDLNDTEFDDAIFDDISELESSDEFDTIEDDNDILGDFDTDNDEEVNQNQFATYHNETVNEENLGISDDSDGVLIDTSDLTDDDDDFQINRDSDFINETGNIVVLNNPNDSGDGFDLKYIDIEKIVISKRIRSMQSVEGLVQSIQSTGLLKPIVVGETSTEGLYVLLDGFRRLQACARAGKVRIPCIINHKVNTTEIPIIEAMYNHSQKYSMKEQVDYINYLEVEKGIMNPAMIEYILQMNSGDYTKLKDILNDNDDDIVSKLMEGAYDIPTAFKKLEQRRKKETIEEQENRKAAAVYDDEEKSGVNQIQGAGEEADGEALTEEQINALTVNANNLDDDLEDTSLNEMIQEDKELQGFKPHKQKVGEREYIDPTVKKSTLARDNFTCQCCKRGGLQYSDILDFHHILPVFLGGADSIENGVMLCVACHRLVHLYSTDDLNIDEALLKSEYDDLDEASKSRYPNAEIFEDEKLKFKRVIKLGGVIRKGIVARGMNKEQYKKEHSNAGIGRRKPGINAEQEQA